MLQSDSLIQFWGKTKAAASGNGAPISHSLVHHSLDVAAVAERLLTVFPRRLAFMAGLCGAGPEAMKALLIRLIALHDIGKFHPSFQMKVPNLCLPELVREGASGGGRHDAIGYKMLQSEEFDILNDFQPCRAQVEKVAIVPVLEARLEVTKNMEFLEHLIANRIVPPAAARAFANKPGQTKIGHFYLKARMKFADIVKRIRLEATAH